MLVDVILWMVAVYLGVGLTFIVFGVITFIVSLYNHSKNRK